MPVLALAVSLACARRPPEPPSPLGAWVGASIEAQQAAGAGDFDRADSVLGRFARAFPASDEAAESQFWRALYQLHPANRQSSPRKAIQAFDAYLALGTRAARQPEATLLRGVAVRLDSLLARPAVVREVETPAPTDSTATQEEVAKLRAELRRTTEELERMRRRLAQPRP